MKRFFGAIVITAAIAAGGWWFYQSNSALESGAAPARGRFNVTPVVGVTPVALQTFVQNVEGLGTARANESVTITAKLTDTVRRINFEDGQMVEAGTVLVELTNREQEALLAEARAALGDAEAQLKRINDLGARGLAAQSEVDQAVAAADGAKARLNTVLARLQDRLIRAPFAGLLGFRQVSPGSLVTPTTAITTLDDVSVIKLDFTLPETQLSFLQPGLSINARSAAWGDRAFTGKISSIGSRIDPVTRAVEVRAVMDNSDGLIRPGMLMSVAVASNEHRALAVGQGSLVSIGNVTYVYVVDDSDTAHRREVELGLRTFDEAEVLSGLRPGERVVTEGVGNMRDGIKVTVKGQGQARAPAVGGPAGTPARV
ncbi:MAG: efflux RND transporter periplasmic adaptor subunit [Pseudomonadota bacterium]